jgi:hypothetical protein
MEKLIVKGEEKTKLNFHVATMEANALIHLFTFTLGVENNNNVKNDANLAKPILTLMKHCLQLGFITSNGPTSETINTNIVKAILYGCTIASNKGRESKLQQIRLK